MTEVLVIGGGPAGSTAASLLARAGVSVKLIERANFPRYHIGESITTSCRGILDYIGALEKVNAQGFTRKCGVLMRWGKELDWTIDWTAQFGPEVRSWQVDREDFDKLLLDHAAENGVEVVQGHVKRVVFDGDRATGVEWTPQGETGQRITGADIVLDASGRAGLISAQHFGNRRPHEIFRNVAIWGYWDGGELLPESPSGGINVISSPDGWYWVIPLRGDRFSVGFVSHQTVFLERRAEFGSTEEMLLAMVEESPTVRDLLAKGVFRSGTVRVEQDFSYVADSFCGPGHFVLGDAACFLDPLLSTGVHLAMYSGLLAAASVLAIGNGDVTEQEAYAFYESLFRNAYYRLFTLVAGFYHKHAGKDRYFALAKTLTREREGMRSDPDIDFGEIIAGITDMREAADRAGRGADPIREVIAAAAGTWTPARELLMASEQAQARARDHTPNRTTTRGPSNIDANDLYDAASGLYLVMTPRLGIGRTAVDAGDAAGGSGDAADGVPAVPARAR